MSDAKLQKIFRFSKHLSKDSLMRISKNTAAENERITTAKTIF